MTEGICVRENLGLAFSRLKGTTIEKVCLAADLESLEKFYPRYPAWSIIVMHKCRVL
jgi:hypothetical protein